MTKTQMPATADKQMGIRPKGYRLPESTHLGRVRLQVAELDRSLLFYEKVLGMRVINRIADSVSLGPHGEDREIVHLRQLSSARPVPRRGLLGLYHFAILLPDRAAGSSALPLDELRRSVDADYVLDTLLAPEPVCGAGGGAVRASFPFAQRRLVLCQLEPRGAACGLGRLWEQRPSLRRISSLDALSRQSRD